MRLIDADALQEHFEKVKKESERLVDVAQIIGVQAVIDSQPTAYDVDKVVEQLEEMLLNLTFYKDNDSKTWNKAIHKSVEIVKSGGIE